MENRYYYAVYKGSAFEEIGCRVQIASQARAEMNFPPQILYYCDLCREKHTFILTDTHLASTPGQQKQFSAWLKDNGIEADVEIPENT